MDRLTKLTAHGLNSALPYAMPDEIDYLKKLTVGFTEAEIVVMIGCGPAVFGLAVMEQRYRAPDMYIIDIDPGMFKYAQAHFEGGDLHPTVLDQISFIEADSSNLGYHWDPQIDLLIVDGDHTYDGVRADIHAWWPSLKVGGFVFFHDYKERTGGFNGIGEWEYGGVKQAIDENLTDEWKYIEEVGISIIYQKVS